MSKSEMVNAVLNGTNWSEEKKKKAYDECMYADEAIIRTYYNYFLENPESAKFCINCMF